MAKVVVGYEFDNEDDYNVAKEELNYINEIKNNPKYINDSGHKLELYNLLITKEKFKTPVGYEFLREIQKELYKNSAVNRESIKSIPYKKSEKPVGIKEKSTTTVKSKEISKNTSYEKNNNSKTYKNYLKYKDLYIKMLIVNIVLILTIVTMFVISRTSKKFDADYYRESIENDYVNWDKALTERESALNEKENSD